MKIKLLLLLICLASALHSVNAQYCSGTTYLTSSSGTFSDGSGANSYATYSNCSWLIQPSTGGTITLSFSSFFTESSYDYVRVYDGSTTSATLLGSFSGSTIPSSIKSSGSSMLVVFTSDGSSNYSGWDASYTTAATVQNCTGTTYLTSSSGTFSDGSGANNYANYSNCGWLIQPSTGGVITLSFGSFFTESNYDYVTVYDGTSTSANILGSFSGSTLPPRVTSTGSSMYVVFTSDGSTSYSGWDATYTSCSLAVPAITYTGSLNSCNGVVNKTLTTPLLSGYSYVWYKDNVAIGSATSNTYTATSLGSYTVLVKSPTGCSKLSSPAVIATSKLVVNAQSATSGVCTGGKLQLNASIFNGGGYVEDFTNFNTTNWSVVGGTVSSAACGFTTNSLFFDGSSTRYIQSYNLNLSNAISISFKLLLSNGGFTGCEQADSGEEVLLQYSLDGGVNWITIQTYYPSNTVQVVTESIPAAAKTSQAIIRLNQTSNSGSGFDNWSIDDLSIAFPSSTGSYTYSWTPTTNLSNASIPNPLATLNSQITYVVTAVETGTGCTGNSSITVAPTNNSIPVTILPTQKTICAGGTSQLSTSLSSSSEFDNFETVNSSLWTLNTGGIYTNSCGSYSGNAILFYSSDLYRSLQSKNFNTSNGGTINFYLKMPNSSSTIYCENPDSGEEVVLEYSKDNVNWVLINTYYNTSFPEFTQVQETLPSGAIGANVSFRWRQLSNSGSSFDYWGLDNVQFNFGIASTYSYSWTPTTSVSNPTNSVTTVAPTSTTTYTVLVTDLVSNCNGAAVTIVNVGGGVAPAAPVISKSGNVFTSNYATGNQWYKNGALISGATGSTYTSTGDGSYAVEVTGTNGCSSISNPFIILGVETNELADNSFELYPNPFENNFTVKLNSNFYSNSDVKVSDMNGKVVAANSIVGGTNEIVISTEDLSKGVYFVKVTNGDKSVVKKVIKQ